MKWLFESIAGFDCIFNLQPPGNARTQTPLMKKLKASRLLVVAAAVFILTGLFCFVNPLKAYVYLVKFSGLVLLLSGIVLQIVSSYAHISFISEKRSMRIESI